jgi:hypothetical protein
VACNEVCLVLPSVDVMKTKISSKYELTYRAKITNKLCLPKELVYHISSIQTWVT